jgi:hypothetical protein
MSSKNSSNNGNVTIRLDSRVFYGLIAIVGVIAFLALGVWVGQYWRGSQQTAATDPAAQTGAVPPGQLALSGDPAAAQPFGISTAVPGAAPGDPSAAGLTAATKPVSPDEVKVGEAEPRLWVEEAAASDWTVDLGQIAADKPVEKDFTIKNVGTSELVIEDTSASCGCTAAKIGESNLAPGATTLLRVSYDPRVNQEFGRFVQKQIRIKSNDPLVPLAEFTITADVASQ